MNNFIANYINNQVLKKKEDYKKMLELEANEKFQVKEKEGKIYLTVDDVPLLEATDLTKSFEETLKIMRQRYLDK